MFTYSHITYVFSRILALPRHVSTANAWLISTGEMSRVNVLKSTKGKLVKHGYTVSKSREFNLPSKPFFVTKRLSGHMFDRNLICIGNSHRVVDENSKYISNGITPYFYIFRSQPELRIK